MSRRIPFTVLALVVPSLFTVACESDAPRDAATAVAESATPAAATVTQKPAAATQDANPQKGRTFGDPIKTTEETALDEIAAEPAKFSGKTVRTSGVVQSVCQAAGCWMEIGDETKRAHIKMAGHAFFVPKDCAGKHAVVEGTVADAPAVDDCTMKDQCGGADNGAVAKTEILATGVELLD